MNSQLDAVGKIRERARTDLFYLATEILGYSYFQKDVHGPLFDLYVKKDRTKAIDAQSYIKNRLILWPRGHLKTTALITDVVQWVLNFPDMRILLVSGKDGLVESLLSAVKKHFETPSNRLSQFFPELCGTRLGNATEFTVPARKAVYRESTVTCSTANSVKSGSHFELICPDDLVNEINSKTPEQLAKVCDQAQDLWPLLENPELFYVTFNGTRYHFNDYYGSVLANPVGWITDVRACWRKKGENYKLLFPQRILPNGKTVGFTFDGLQALQKSHGNQWFANHYLNDPLVVEDQLFPEELVTSHISNELPAHLGPPIIHWDLAESEKKRADFTVGVVGRMDMQGRIWIVDGRAGRYNSYDLVKHMIDLALEHRPIEIVIEKTKGASYLEPSLDALARANNINLPLRYETMSNKPNAKDGRIGALHGLFKDDQVFIYGGIRQLPELIQQFTRYPKGHDDWPDAVALLAAYLLKNGPVTVRPLPNPFMKVRPTFTPPLQKSASGLGYGFIA